MFSTFAATSAHDQHALSSDPPSAPTKLSRRQQVSRACGWCRAYRIKCDDKVPCRNCVTKGRNCADKGGNDVRTYSLALKEIDRLKSKVSELEHELNAVHFPYKNSTHAPALPEHLDPLREYGGNRGSWENVLTIVNEKTRQAQCYGPASSNYFKAQMNSYLEKTLSRVCPQLYSQAAVASLFCPIAALKAQKKTKTFRRTSSTSQKPLSRWQEEYFLDLFWQSYHCMYPIVDETEFRALHNDVWVTPYEPRKSSALVDIILAVTMQYATAILPPDLTNSVISAEERGKHAASAGRSYYRRCQTLLSDDMEAPSIETVQCRFFSVIYLANANSLNAAYSMLALAVRAATILGLHREPLNNLDEDGKNFHRRLWWTVYALEISFAMELGRTLSINISQVTSKLPADAPQMGSISIPGDTTSLGIGSAFAANLQFIKLILATRSVYILLYRRSAELLGPSHTESLHTNPRALESCAEFVASKMQYLETWKRDLPTSLRMRRRGSGEWLSTDGSPLDVQPVGPAIQQRQRVFLELHYHTVVMNLFRPFIYFSQPTEHITPVTEANGVACVSHAITITNIIHQMLTETDLLRGWLECFQWHGNAFISLVGYVLAYPKGQKTAEARIAIRRAITTFDILSSSLSMAASAAEMARGLATKADIVVDRFNSGTMALDSSGTIVDVSSDSQQLSQDGNDEAHQAAMGCLAAPDIGVETPAALTDLLGPAGSMDWISDSGDQPLGMMGLVQDMDMDMEFFVPWMMDNHSTEPML
ncbi:hypothetical protein K402DRAFT_354082 [Aulographum hederae CBS 113979]|uniref:Zn(2)-C6 fungal-type domain-containing protein n=1 Tax=Aulographum hederae CBS 113979 TaxID=1176131 RepID=A0A6G1H2Q9_9PEZI|nr:hypothetical protein K402DRAFT_354082 [Aulographum hederae CBS 113979]